MQGVDPSHAVSCVQQAASAHVPQMGSLNEKFAVGQLPPPVEVLPEVLPAVLAAVLDVLAVAPPTDAVDPPVPAPPAPPAPVVAAPVVRLF